jgi:glyoxylase-like metal-dependent hydrolase (beta-lactamase superfamily II)
MNAAYFSFKVGAIECVALSDGTLAYQNPAKILFANAPSQQLTQALHAYDIQPEQWSEWISPFICLLIRTGEHDVLVDTGVGTVDFAPNAGKLPQNLRSVGIALSDIDTVVLTHGHTDHVGGITEPSGKAVFTNARYVMWRQEWEFWNSDAGLTFDEGDALHARRKLQPLADRLDLIDHETEIAPGVHAFPAPGHTPGHMALSVVSENSQLLYVADAFAHPIHLQHPEWNIITDYQPEIARRTRQQLIDRAVAENALVLAFHFDFPGLGHIQRRPGEVAWRPVTAMT